MEQKVSPAEKVMAVLEAIRDSSSAITQAQISEQTRVDRATVCRILADAISRGWVEPVAGGYCIGLALARFWLVGIQRTYHQQRRLLQQVEAVEPDAESGTIN